MHELIAGVTTELDPRNTQVGRFGEFDSSAGKTILPQPGGHYAVQNEEENTCRQGNENAVSTF